jgi:hypothetical protein
LCTRPRSRNEWDEGLFASFVSFRVVCASHPRDRVKAALRAAGKQLALAPDSVSVQVRPTDLPTVQRIAVLEFEMRRAAQYKVVDDIFATVEHYAWEFYEDITVRFPKG